MRIMFQLTLNVNGKQNTDKETKTFFTLAEDTEEAVLKVRRYLAEDKLLKEAKIEKCSPKPALTFVEDTEVK